MSQAPRRIGDFLIAKGLIDIQQLDRALKTQRKDSRRLGEILVDQGALSEDGLIHALGELFGMDVIHAAGVDLHDEVISRIPPAVALKHAVVPIAIRDDTDLVVATTGPLSQTVRELLARMSRMRICPVLLGWKAFAELLDRAYHLGERGASSGSQRAALPIASVAPSQAGDDVEVTGWVDGLLLKAVSHGASDIHLEPEDPLHRVRLRVDGVLHVTDRMTPVIAAQAISRLKVMADLDISERRRPQDGAFLFDHGELKTPALSVRLSTLPCAGGEKAVLRLLPPRDQTIPLEELGMRERPLAGLRQALASPHGLVLVTGPTGSGKSTTLYSSLAELRSDGVNITTVEDPVEMRMRGISQVQVDTTNRVGFASALRSILRQDPDVIMVGEVRDQETAGLALRAALTGHLVLTTLHTNEAISSVSRLIDMGCEPYLLADAMRGVLAQRLVRRPCPSCAVERPLSASERLHLGLEADEDFPVRAGPGCSACSDTGFRGRIAIHEFLAIDEVLQAIIARRASPGELAAEAQRQGHAGLRDDGIAKIKNGLTTPGEVIRVVMEV